MIKLDVELPDELIAEAMMVALLRNISLNDLFICAVENDIHQKPDPCEIPTSSLEVEI